MNDFQHDLIPQDNGIENFNGELDLFSEELEDRFNAGTVSSASTASSLGGTYSTASTYCSIF